PIGVWLLILGVSFLGLLLRRVSRMTKILSSGPRLPAAIRDMGFFRDRGRIAFSFSFQGKEVTARAVVMKTRDTQALSIGDPVEAAVDEEKPERSLIFHLFIE
ncbi:MAG: hypothetical protein AB1921_02650, partial [Thermodesulfobacteriota bacterium]